MNSSVVSGRLWIVLPYRMRRFIASTCWRFAEWRADRLIRKSEHLRKKALSILLSAAKVRGYDTGCLAND